ncbi:MAG TPA: cache domain-containing protein [Duganella sp.]|jgi:signal transduction histidine kinase
MKTFFGAVAGVVAFSLISVSSVAIAADKGNKDEAIAMVKRAVALIKSDGKEKAFAAISDPANTSFHDRDLYVYVYDLNGVALAHGNNPKMVGKNLMGLKDNEGKAMIKELVDLAKSKGSGWVDFKWPNPVTKTVEAKAGYVEKVDDILVGSGIYK